MGACDAMRCDAMRCDAFCLVLVKLVKFVYTVVHASCNERRVTTTARTTERITTT